MPIVGTHLIKRSMNLAGHRTSVALEPEYWAAFDALALALETTKPTLMVRIDEERRRDTPERNLASAVRTYLLKHKKET